MTLGVRRCWSPVMDRNMVERMEQKKQKKQNVLSPGFLF
jgi:hypothetical protein